MRLILAAVGKGKAGPERALFEQYQGRLGWPLALKEVEEKRPLPVAERMAREAELLLAQVPAGAVIVALDERGRPQSSPAFAERLRGWRDEGRACIAFLIGGADGHDERVRGRADMLLSFGSMTWPHMLVRGLLAEQLYRAECILANHPYHRGRE
ncbi:ribosomal RNA large subunit methyltransferase H [mine drainage metagenome]|uniref:Ribosomal RNA large subunit methyltransferase H n=1 Tax=mine drainage metagenome TaxID=410659 RepID=A0A1J5RB36_9ZZZZ